MTVQPSEYCGKTPFNTFKTNREVLCRLCLLERKYRRSPSTTFSHSFIVIPPKSNALLDTPLLGPIVRAHRLYPGLHKHNHHPEYRISVEHVFASFSLNSLFYQYLIVFLPPFSLNTLYIPLLFYHYLLLLQHS